MPLGDSDGKTPYLRPPTISGDEHPALPQLLEVAAPATPAAAELSERIQALLADYRLAADPATYFSDEPG